MRNKQGPSEDTVPIREHLEALIAEAKELTDAKFVTYRTLIDSQADKVALALTAADKAITKQETATNERLALLNELRSGVATKEQLDALIERVSDLKERVDKQEGKGIGQAALFGYAVAIISIVVVIANYLSVH